jgi:hypothetical protein
MTTTPESEMPKITRDEFPNLYDWQIPILQKWGHLLNNTGGNAPADLLNQIQSQKGADLLQTNLPVYLLAFGVHTQIQVIHTLQSRGIIHEHKWVEELRFWDVSRGTVVMQRCGCGEIRKVPISFLKEKADEKEEEQ